VGNSREPSSGDVKVNRIRRRLLDRRTRPGESTTERTSNQESQGECYDRGYPVLSLVQTEPFFWPPTWPDLLFIYFLRTSTIGARGGNSKGEAMDRSVCSVQAKLDWYFLRRYRGPSNTCNQVPWAFEHTCHPNPRFVEGFQSWNGIIILNIAATIPR
jgi:hypothetical protein